MDTIPREIKRHLFIIITSIFLVLVLLTYWSHKGPIFVEIIVAYLGYLNWWSAQNKLRLELFEKRWEIYEQLVKTLSLVSRDARIDYQDTMRLLAGLN